jgi:TetR/AcrR family transcriptional repressor of nem operon
MARTREFDLDAAVEAAMRVFWRRGYAATSIQHLVEATGVGRGSLYAAFGSKDGLYEAALTRYAEATAAANSDRLERVAPARDVLRGLLVGIVDDTVQDPDRRGCLISNTAVERLPHDAVAGRVVGQSLDRLAESIRAVLRRARGDGDLPPDADLTAQTDLVLTTVQGIRVLGKAGADRRRLLAVVDLVISLIFVPERLAE